MSNIDYTLWPNANGNLGENKVQIPDGVNTTWPEGDALVGNFVYNKGNLVGFVDTKALIANESKSTTFPYDYVNIQVDKSLEGVMTFNQGERTKYFTVTYSESGNSGDTVILKYKGCKTVDDVKAVDSNYLTNDIIDGVWTEWLGDLTNGDYMFDNCYNLESFNSDLPSLTNGYQMFYNCSNLTSFTSDLSSLTNGSGMFSDCKLDTASVQNIADTIKDVNELIQDCSADICKDISIRIGNFTPNEQEETAFNQMVSKGWTVYVNGSEFISSGGCSSCSSCCASLTTLDETYGEFVAPKPYWAKPVPSDEKHARYVDSEGNFYNILGAQFIYGDNLETYGMFTSLEDAAANMRLKKIGEEEIETA